MVRRFQRLDAIAGAVLLSASETGGAAPADSRTETDAYEGADADRWIVLGQARAEGDDAGDAFVAADVGEFDGCYGRAIRTRCCAGGCVEVFWWWWLWLVDEMDSVVQVVVLYDCYAPL